MTFLELQDLCLTWLDDVNAGYFTRPQIKRFLNNALHECQKELIQSGEPWYMRCVQTNTIAQKDSYALPSDFLKLHRLDLYTQGDGSTPNTDAFTVLVPMTPVESTTVPLGPSTPMAYYLKKDCIVLRGFPDRAYPLRLTYSYRASEMSIDTETPDVPIQYQEYLAILATLDGFMKDQRDASQFMVDKRQAYRDLMKQDANDRNVDFPRSTVRTMNDSWEVFF